MSFQLNLINIIQQQQQQQQFDNTIQRTISDSVGDQSILHEQHDDGESYLDIEADITDRYLLSKDSEYNNNNNNSIGRGSCTSNRSRSKNNNRQSGGGVEFGITDSSVYNNKLDQTQTHSKQVEQDNKIVKSPKLQDFAKKNKVLTKQRSAQRIHKMDELNNTTNGISVHDDSKNVADQYDGNNVVNNNIGKGIDRDDFDLINVNTSRNRIHTEDDDDYEEEEEAEEEDNLPIKSLELSIPIPTMINIPDQSYQNHNMYQSNGTEHQYTPFLSAATSSSLIPNNNTMYSSTKTTTTNGIGNNNNNNNKHRQSSTDGNHPPIKFPGRLGTNTTSLGRSTSDQSAGSFLYCKTPNSTGIFGKSSSLIFPTGVDNSTSTGTGVGDGSGGGGGGCSATISASNAAIGDSADFPNISNVSNGTNSGIHTASTLSTNNNNNTVAVPSMMGTGTPVPGPSRQSQHPHQLRHSNSSTSSSLPTNVSTTTNKVPTIPEGAYEDHSNSGGIGSSSNNNNNNYYVYSSAAAAANQSKKASIHLAIDQCENCRGFPFSKKKLILSNLKLFASDIPLSLLCKTQLGNTLHKLDLSNNVQLGSIPPLLVQSLPSLRILNLSQCSLNALPDKWVLPKLRKLDLSHNRLDFPEESIFAGLPELQELRMYGNTVKVIIVPTNPKVLSRLETLDLGYNDLVCLPLELDRLKSLRTLRVMNNFLDKVPARICEMDLKTIDVSSNPITEPPIETCERGICVMRRYWNCIRLEEQTKIKAVRNQAKLLSMSASTIASQPSATSICTGSTSIGAPILTSQQVINENTHNKVRRGFFGKLPKMTQQQQSTSSGSARRGNTSITSSIGSIDNTGAAFGVVPPTSPIPSVQPTVPEHPSSSFTRPTGSSVFSLTDHHGVHSSFVSLQPVSSVRRQTSVTSTSSNGSSLESISSPKGKPSPQISIITEEEGMPSVDSPHITPKADPAASLKGIKDSESEIELIDHPLKETRLQSESSDDLLLADTELSAVKLVSNQLTTVNDTLKVIFIGMAMVGKTTMIRRLIEGTDAEIPTKDERTVGVDIYSWEPKVDKRFEHIDSRIQFQDAELAGHCGDVDIKFSVWDFAGQHVYHATHELFFSSRALYVLVWDMGATNADTFRRKQTSPGVFTETGAFNLSYDSSSDEEDDDYNNNNKVNVDLALATEREARRADRALERDIDDKVLFWVDCIQSSAPGAAILPVASHSDYFDESTGGQAEAIRRCNVLKQRLLKHEERRRCGIEERMRDYRTQNPPNEQAAERLQKLLCPYQRPKLIFGHNEDDSVVRVSGKNYFGFDRLTEKIVNIATGREKGECTYPVFHGHVGARIPRMRLQVRDAVREMRDRFKVVEWGYFVKQLREQGEFAVEDISDALHFLTNTGELSYFGSVMQSPPERRDCKTKNNGQVDEDTMAVGETVGADNADKIDDIAHSEGQNEGEHSDDDDVDDDGVSLSIDDTDITAPSTLDGSLTTVDDFMSTGLSQFVFLNPRWLVAAVACILRHDLDREIKETRRLVSLGEDRQLSRTASFFDAQLNCPVITASDAQMLWRANRITKKAAERAERFSNDHTMSPFEFLQRLLIRFGVFVPIDLNIEKATFGGKDYQRIPGTEVDCLDSPVSAEIVVYHNSKTNDEKDSSNAENFFLPSLLGKWEHFDAWTYKNVDSWKTTLCHSVQFPDGVPPGLMERLTATVLSSIYAVTSCQDAGKSTNVNTAATCEGRMSLKEVLCWRTAFYLKIGSRVPSVNGVRTDSLVEIFVQLADRDDALCVGSDYMEVGAQRLIVSARGQEGDGGRKIWKGGYLLVIKCVTRVMQAYGGLEYELQGVCPECLAKVPVSQASSWEVAKIRNAVVNNDRTLRCRHFGHPVDTRFLAGPLQRIPDTEAISDIPRNESSTVAVRDLQHAVVVVGLWDGREKKLTRVGSGFICDKKRGLIVTAAHTLMNIWGDPDYAYGENYYGLSQGKVVIGVNPDVENKQGAVFRYFAKIVARCSFLDKRLCKVDACVLRITTRMETDVGGDGSGCGDVPEILLLNNPRALKNERLQTLKMTSKCELNENVRILGYNQGGEGMVQPGEVLNRFIDLSRGYVSKKFVHDHNKVNNNNNTKDNAGAPSSTIIPLSTTITKKQQQRDRFQPREEIVISDCHTIGGHSGGPCVNQQGEVIGILSRADDQRCYLVPTSELDILVREAKKEMYIHQR